MSGPEPAGDSGRRRPTSTDETEGVTVSGGPADPDGSGGVDGRGVAETVTAGGSWPPGDHPADPLRLLEAGHRDELAAEAEPNGWFAGPPVDPDRFELLGPGLAGGEGNTWRARYKGALTAPLTLAVKELRRPARAPAGWPTPADVRRWDDQRALLQYMRIDHLVTVIDIFVGPPPHLPGPDRRRDPDTPYVVMEWVPGPTLTDELSGLPATAATIDQRLAHVQHVAEALHSLHSRTVSAGNPTLHRDVKPTNCILDPRRGVVLVDVGTMRRMDDGYDHDGLHTPAYTAPEVLADPQAARSVASDLYSLGALAYFCVLGEDPPTADQPDAAERIETRLLAAARAAGVGDPRRFVDHLRLMLGDSPHHRPGDAMAWARRLRALAAPRARRLAAVPRGWALAAAGAVVVAVGFTGLGAAGVGPLASDPKATVLPNPGGTAGGPGGPGGNQAAGSGGGAGAAGSTATPTGYGYGPAGVGGPTGTYGRPPSPPYGPPPGPGPYGFPPGPPPTGFPPAGAPGGPGGPGGPEGAIRTKLAAISTPANGGSIGLCVLVTGTAKPPAGHTLLLAITNLSVGVPVRHLRAIDGWQTPAGLAHWQVPVFVGLPSDPVGTHYRIETFVVPLSALEKQVAAGAGGDNWTVPAKSVVAASVFVARAALTDPQPTCAP